MIATRRTLPRQIQSMAAFALADAPVSYQPVSLFNNDDARPINAPGGLASKHDKPILRGGFGQCIRASNPTQRAPPISPIAQVHTSLIAPPAHRIRMCTCVLLDLLERGPIWKQRQRSAPLAEAVAVAVARP